MRSNLSLIPVVALFLLSPLHAQKSAKTEPTNAKEAAEKKAAADKLLDEQYTAHIATLPPDRQAWERVLQENLGGFYLPIHKRQKIAGQSNAWDFVQDDPELPRVLLVGDSVSRGYTQAVRKNLAGQANTHRAPANCGPTATGLKKLDVWLGDGKWDLIHFNFGIHDRKTPMADYTARLEELVERLAATGATLVWASTTPIPDDPPKKQTAVSIVERNRAAAALMKKHGVEIDDLFTAITPHLGRMQNPNDVHFNADGYRFLGKQVATFIENALSAPAKSSNSSLDAAVRAAKEYLSARDPGEKNRLAEQLDSYQGDLNSVADALRPKPAGDAVEPGYYKEEHFKSPALRKKHPEDLLYIVVPKTYRRDQPIGLIVFMHGGGKGSLRTAPARYMQTPAPDAGQGGTAIGDLFEAAGMIGVAPSAPWNEEDHQRWCLPEADDYIADVIHECHERYHIDSDRVFLIGHSMGGFGAFHQVQRQPDRFAAVVASAGSWGIAQWPVIRGTTLCIVHGAKDAELGVRDRHTDIAYGRWTNKLLTARKIPHVYKEHAGGHSVGYGKPHILDFLQANRDLRRDPFAPHVAVASPVGYSESKCYPTIHNRWVTLEKTTEADLAYDILKTNGRGHSKDSSVADWNSWELNHRIGKRPGALLEAVLAGNNRIAVTTENVAQFSIWLHEEMIDLDRPVVIMHGGKKLFEGRVEASLATMLDSFERRRDWSLVYPARLTLTVP